MNHTEDEKILGNLVFALHKLESCAEFAHLIPEVRVNIAYAKRNANSPDDVAAVDGRITVVNGMPKASGLPKWGASDHMARLIMETRQYSSEINAGINFKCDAEIIKVVREFCTKNHISFGYIDRKQEPEDITLEDKKSMPWKIKYLKDKYNSIPKIFYEGEGWGKEPLFVIIGKDALEVTEIAISIAKEYEAYNRIKTK